MYRGVAGPKEDRYGRSIDELERDSTKTVAKATLKPQDAVKLALAVGKRAGALRAAIATGNDKAVEIEDLDPGLFE